MTGQLRPLGVGYVREHFMMTAAEVAKARDQLTRFAAAEGLTLQCIYIEKLETEPAAFQALVDAARPDEVAAVVVPTLQHLEPRFGERSRREHLERNAGVRVLVAASSKP